MPHLLTGTILMKVMGMHWQEAHMKKWLGYCELASLIATQHAARSQASTAMPLGSRTASSPVKAARTGSGRLLTMLA